MRTHNLVFYANALKWFKAHRKSFVPPLSKAALNLVKDDYQHNLNKLDVDYLNANDGIVSAVVNLYTQLCDNENNELEYPYYYLANSNAQKAFLIEDVTKQMKYYTQKLEESGIPELWNHINHNDLEHRLVVGSMIEWENRQNEQSNT